MAESKQSRVVMFDNSDPEMQRAYEQARATFRYFWREVAWDRRRIVPALGLAAIKAPFSDEKPENHAGGTPQVEHMWLSEVDYDGEFVSGVLVNSPNWVKSVKEGDSARFRIDEISDWMYAISGSVHGAYTVNLMRSRMTPRERRDHDAAWGMNFGDPHTIRMVSEEDHRALCENMASSLKKQLAKDPALLSRTGLHGWTFLHQDASAGSIVMVRALLEAGADPAPKADNGMTPLQLARALGWDEVVAVLEDA